MVRCKASKQIQVALFADAAILKFVIPNPALPGEGSAFFMPRTADPSHEAVRDGD
jgi:hypothetical protein